LGSAQKSPHTEGGGAIAYVATILTSENKNASLGNDSEVFRMSGNLN